MTLFNTSDPARRTGSAGEETAAQILAEVPDESFDLVIMNPPFTRAGSDWEGSSRQEDYVKQFRGLATSLDTQKEMSDRLKRHARGTCTHGYAGIASAFAALADRKLKPGGVLALVLPVSAATGISWREFRCMMESRYADLAVLSIAAADNDDLSFSADTGLGECLVITRKLKPGEPASERVHFTSLHRRPQGFAHASAIAQSIICSDYVRHLEDGPYGGTLLTVGAESAGEMLTAPSSSDGSPWGAVRVSDFSLAQTAHALSLSQLWLPGSPAALNVKVVPLQVVGERGLYHRNVNGPTAPFTKIVASATATYPSLWNHDAHKETRMVCEPDSQLLVRMGMEARAANVWETAGRAHLNLDFRFNSQPLTVAITEQQCIGGRAWPNINFPDERFDYAFALWGNCTLGLLLFWWHANPQVAGRATTTIKSSPAMPVFDFHALSDDQLVMAELIFDEFRDRELQPAYLADADSNRALLDRRVVCDLLEFDETVYEGVRRLTAKWCAEPSVHGGKQRPANATLLV